MTSLVEELQREALDPKVGVADLLRKALVVATKLNLRKFRSWVEKELNGYTNGDVPDYRVIIGNVRVINPFRGYIPFICPDPKLTRIISTHNERCPLGTLQELVDRGESEYTIDFHPEMRNLLMQGQDYPMIPQLLIARSAYVGVIETVRNEVLTWSLKLEADGIIGLGMSFSPHEKQLASSNPRTENAIHYLENLRVGQRFVSGTHRIDEEQIRAFAQQFNSQPFHFDPESAKATFL